jgi:hypothetical protein
VRVERAATRSAGVPSKTSRPPLPPPPPLPFPPPQLSSLPHSPNDDPPPVAARLSGHTPNYTSHLGRMIKVGVGHDLLGCAR